jgi:salicylate hydroxylase
LTRHEDRVEVQFQNGATATVDVVIGADGIHSTVREAILGPESPRFSGHVAYRGLVPAARVAHLGIEVVASSWWGPGHHFVHYFVGAGARYLNWVAVTLGEWRIESWTAKGEVADALKEFEGWHSQVRAIVGAVDAPNRWALSDGVALQLQHPRTIGMDRSSFCCRWSSVPPWPFEAVFSRERSIPSGRVIPTARH